MTLAVLAGVISFGVLKSVAFADSGGSVQFEAASADDISSRNMAVYAGADRYETSRLVSATVAESGSYYGLIVVSAANGKFADALCASGLSGVLGYPLVLIDGSRDALSETGIAQISELTGGAQANIIVIGGEQTISDSLMRDLSDYGMVSRISGEDRYATSEAIYTYGTKHGGWPDDYAVVAKGNDFPDALGAASFCTAHKAAMLLTDAGNAELETYIVRDTEHVDEIVIVGGSESVSDTKAAALGSGAVRISGTDRYDTNLKFASWQLDHDMSMANVGIATGRNFPDSLGSSFLLSMDCSVLLLISPYSDFSSEESDNNIYDFLKNNASQIYGVRVFGGENSVSAATKSVIRTSIGGAWTITNYR